MFRLIRKIFDIGSTTVRLKEKQFKRLVYSLFSFVFLVLTYLGIKQFLNNLDSNDAKLLLSNVLLLIVVLIPALLTVEFTIYQIAIFFMCLFGLGKDEKKFIDIVCVLLFIGYLLTFIFFALKIIKAF